MVQDPSLRRAPRSDFLFFNGDIPPDTSSMDAGVGSDLVRMYKPYAFRRGTPVDLMAIGTSVVPVPGSHEIQCKSCGKKALPVNEKAWRANMGDPIPHNRRMLTMFGHAPGFENVSNNGPVDGLTLDQS